MRAYFQLTKIPCHRFVACLFFLCLYLKSFFFDGMKQILIHFFFPITNIIVNSFSLIFMHFLLFISMNRYLFLVPLYCLLPLMKFDQTEKVDVSRLRLMENDQRRTFEQMIRKITTNERMR